MRSIVRVMAAAVAVAAGCSLALTGPAGAASGPTPGSPAYIARDLENMEAAFGRTEVQLEDPSYLPDLFLDGGALYAEQLAHQLENPTRLSLTFGSLIPGYALGNPDRQAWNGTRGQELPVTFTAPDGAELQGDVFAPLPGARNPYTGALLQGPYPGAVILEGSIQAPRNDYEWLAQDLAEVGYVVLTFDVQGQGSSETLPHEGSDPDLPSCGDLKVGAGQVTPCPGVPSEQDQNFVDSAEAAITFFLSTPSAPDANVGAGSLAVNAYNPLWDLFNHTPDTQTATPGRTTRLALIGHSTGAVIASYLQGVDPRIETVVALDKLTATPASISDDEALTGSLPGPVVPKVPALAIQAEYGFEPQPYFVADCSSFEPCLNGAPELDQAPDPNREEATGFDIWQAAHIDSMVIVPRASTHLIFTDAPPVLPATVNGQQMASFYVQAWLDKYLKHDQAAGYALLSPTIRYFGPNQNGTWTMHTFNRDANLSFYFCSGYEFNLPGGKTFTNDDLIDDGCS